MTYTYFVSYSFLSKNQSAEGFGSVESTSDRPITTFQHIKDITRTIEERIEKTQSLQVDCIILNYILLNKTEE